ncbi:hypothetical protein B0X78_03410 [bacterium AM6]|nr:hypothetical protein B0X78_03410 [bacterium AM6]
MLLGHPVRMAQHNPRFPPVRRRAHGRARPVPFAAPAVDLEAEYQFWQVYDRVVRPLPGGGSAWPGWCCRPCTGAARYPADTHKAALSRVLFGTNMTDARAAELEELYGLVSRRLAAVAVRTLAPGSTA